MAALPDRVGAGQNQQPTQQASEYTAAARVHMTRKGMKSFMAIVIPLICAGCFGIARAPHQQTECGSRLCFDWSAPRRVLQVKNS